jgi:hypothetical protein
MACEAAVCADNPADERQSDLLGGKRPLSAQMVAMKEPNKWLK